MSSLKGAWSGSRDTFYNFTPPEISLQRLGLQRETSIFVHELATWSVSLVVTILSCPPSGSSQDHVTYVTIFTARCYASAVLAMALCLSVRPFVTSRCSTTTAKRRITQTTSHDSLGTLVFIIVFTLFFQDLVFLIPGIHLDPDDVSFPCPN